MKFQVVIPNKNSSQHNQQDVLITATDTLMTWHEKMAHQNLRHVKQVLQQFQMKIKDTNESFCEACAVGKIHRLPFPSSTSETKEIDEIIHADVCGPMQTASIGGSRYFLLFKDDFSHFRTIYFITEKSEVKRCIEDFFKKTEKQCQRGVRILRTDNGLEFINQGIEDLTHPFWDMPPEDSSIQSGAKWLRRKRKLDYSGGSSNNVACERIRDEILGRNSQYGCTCA